MDDDPKILTAGEVCAWFRITFDQLRQLRLRRDGTRFPPPLLGEHGLAWYEHDLCSWVCFVDDWRAAVSAGEDPRAALDVMTPPVYLAPEPEARNKVYR